MDRRQFIIGVSSVLPVVSGCLGGSEVGSVGGNKLPYIELVDVDTVEEDYEISLEVSVTEPFVSTDHPAFIRIAITNEGSDRRIATTDPDAHYDLLFAPYSEELSDPRGVVLRLAAVTDESDGPNDGDGRWSVDPPEGTGSAGPGLWTFPSGETITQKFRLLDEADGDYYPTGTYRFQNDFTFRSVDKNEVVASFNWGFTISVGRQSRN